MSDPVKELLRTVEIGLDAQQFLGTNIGRYLIERAEGEVAAAIDQLKVIDPDDRAGIQKLQNQIWRAESIQFWLADLIQEGTNAEETLQQIDGQ